MATDEFSFNKQLLLFKTIQHSHYEQLDDCQKQEFAPWSSLNSELRQNWMNGIRLDLAHEGKDEFLKPIGPG